MMALKKIENKAALVTGGSRGIGSAIVRRLVREGWHVGFTYHHHETVAQNLVAELRNTIHPQQEIRAYRADLIDENTISRLPEKMIADFGRLDALVNNAGITDDGAFLTMDSTRWQRVLHTNFTGTACLCLAAIPALLRQTHSAIVMMASLAGVTGKEGQVSYATSKGALIGLTQYLGRRYGVNGLRVNAIAPGFVRTAMLDALAPEMIQHIIAGTALQRMGEAYEIAAVVQFLLEPGYLQSTTLKVDGGFKR